MEIGQALELSNPFIEVPFVEFQINQELLHAPNRRQTFNEIVREFIDPNRYGVYLWVNNANQEILYIGMAGTIKNDGTYGNHSLQNRMLASRGKDPITGIDIQTNDYVFSIMSRENITVFKFIILYTAENQPPSYLESLLLYTFYQNKNRLPLLNNSF